MSDKTLPELFAEVRENLGCTALDGPLHAEGLAALDAIADHQGEVGHGGPAFEVGRKSPYKPCECSACIALRAACKDGGR